jgi:hypothetical protein
MGSPNIWWFFAYLGSFNQLPAYIFLILGSLSVFAGALLTFLKNRADTKEDLAQGHKPKSYRFFPPLAFIMVILGLLVSFCDSYLNIGERIKSDSALDKSKQINDSLNKRMMNLLGGGSIQPQFIFAHLPQDIITFIIRDSSMFPVRDISVNILDVEGLQLYKIKLKSTIEDSVLRAATQLATQLNGNSEFEMFATFPYLTHESMRTLQTITIPKDKPYIDYKVMIDWTNGSLNYYIKCWRTPSGWKDSVKRFDRISGITTIK